MEAISLSNDNVTLTAYVLDASPEMPNAKRRPAVLIFPGGGYNMCSDREAEPVAMAFLAEGYHAFVLRYSIKNQAEFPRPLNDAEEALELIRSRSTEWGIESDKVAVCGFSAGGHLAAALGTMGRVKPNALILGYPCILESMGTILRFPIPGVDQYVDSTTPPTFLFHTFADALVPVENSLAFADALDRAKVPFELHIFQNGAHGISLAKPLTSSGQQKMVDSDAAKWFDLSLAWLKNRFDEFEFSDNYEINEQIEEYNLQVQVGVLWKNEACKKAILDTLPQLQDIGSSEEAQAISLETIIDFGKIPITSDELARLDQKLKGIPVLK